MTSRSAVALFVATLLGAGFAGGTAVAQDGAKAGTIKLLSRNGLDTIVFENDAGEYKEEFVSIAAKTGAKYLVIGPVTTQADFRVHLPAEWKDGTETYLTIYLASKPYKRFKVVPKRSSSEKLEGVDSLTPSAPAGFYLPLGPGAHVVEFRADIGGAPGASVLLVDARSAVRKLSSPPPDPPKDTQVMDRGGDDGLVDPFGNEPTGPASVSAIKGGGNRRFLERYSWGLGVQAGAIYPSQTNQTFGPYTSVMLSRTLTDSITLGISVSHAFVQELDAADPARALPRSLVTLNLVPIEFDARYYIRGRNRRVDPYVNAGAGGVVAFSKYESVQQEEDEIGFGGGGHAALGIEVDLSTDVWAAQKESKSRLFFQIGAVATTGSFEHHDVNLVLGGAATGGVYYKF